MPRQEMRGIRGLAKYFEDLNGRPGQLQNAVAAYIAKLEADRAGRFPAVEKSREAFREWITIEAGHFHLIHTPDGVRKEAKSISWASMDDTAFEPLYRDVFAACWRLVLSSHFENEADAMAAADRGWGLSHEQVQGRRPGACDQSHLPSGGWNLRRTDKPPFGWTG
ncbi:DUF1367 family protein [Pseudomonas aeruginosa]|nr:DUF1367 family protein [Pseudomonas aeruginosa]